jgi:hypothetical protein
MVILLKTKTDFDIFDIVKIVKQFNTIDDVKSLINDPNIDISYTLRQNGYSFVDEMGGNILIDLNFNSTSNLFSYRTLFNSYRKFKIKNILK